MTDRDGQSDGPDRNGGATRSDPDVRSIGPDDTGVDPGARTLVVGLDGADFRYLDRFADELPTISGLRSRGVEAPLVSTHPPTTASVWPSVYTGVPPSDHGVAGFFTYEGDDPTAPRLVTRQDVAAPAVWEYLAAVGGRSVVVNVPVTHPSGRVEGALVPGYFAPPGADPSPPDVLERVSHADYGIYPGSSGPSQSSTAEDRDGGGVPGVDALVEAVHARADLTVSLLDAVDWRFAMVVVQATDTVAHDHGTDRALRRVYAAADEAVGALLEAVPDGTAVLLCSDHGMGPADGYRVRVNERLRDRGLLAGSGEPSTRTVGDATGREPGIARLVAAACARAVRRGLDAAGIESDQVPGAVKRVGDAVFGSGRPVEDVDWRDSRAFCRVGSEYGVRVNLAGREPGGVVPESEYERVRSAVVEALSTLETPAGAPVFESVARYESVAGSPPTGDAPDVCVRPAAGNAVSALLTGRRLDPADGMTHRRRGVFVAADGPFAGVDPPGQRSVTDVVPIAMASLGLPVPARSAGSVPRSFPTGERRRYEGVDAPREDPDGDAPDTRAGDDRIHERLADLGYL